MEPGAYVYRIYMLPKPEPSLIFPLVSAMLLLHRLHMEGPKRFGELRRRLGSISTKTLTDRLRMLEAEGWIHRHYEPTVPPQVTYTLAKRVLELDPVMIELDRIAERWYGGRKKGK